AGQPGEHRGSRLLPRGGAPGRRAGPRPRADGGGRTAAQGRQPSPAARRLGPGRARRAPRGAAGGAHPGGGALRGRGRGQLLAEDPARNKAAIIALSKAMYVMTPYTSLLVLENEEMYRQYEVDRGRKDHWAMYPCPERIKVITEPLPPGSEPESQLAYYPPA